MRTSIGFIGATLLALLVTAATAIAAMPDHSDSAQAGNPRSLLRSMQFERLHGPAVPCTAEGKDCPHGCDSLVAKDCKRCNGTGLIGYSNCSVCSGKGVLFVPASSVECRRCKGTGLIGYSSCTICGGTGYVGPAADAQQGPLRAMDCRRCTGTGLIGYSNCTVCSGKGVLFVPVSSVECRRCRGTGLVGYSNCSICNGTGYVGPGR